MVVSRVTKIELGEVKERETGGIHSAGEKTSDGTRERGKRDSRYYALRSVAGGEDTALLRRAV